MLRHVIALTDGRSITNLARQGSVLDKLQAGRATVSVVGLGSDVDQEELLAIAQRGGGRAWFPKSLDDLPAILLDETVERVRENALTEEVEVYPVAGSLFVEGVDTLPPLQGRVRTESRPATEQGVVTEQGEPILASWRRGRGWVTVWASDAGARWATGAWADGSQKLLMERVVRGILSEQPSNLQLTARAAAHGVRLEFSVRDALGQARNDLLVEAVLLSTSGEGEAFVLPPVGAGRYGRLVEITGPSLIEVRAVGERKPRLGSGGLVPGGVALLSLSPPAPLEAHLGTLAEALTEQRVQSTGGRLNPAPQAFADAPRTREVLTERSSLFAFWGFLMWLAALLLRRLGLFHGVRPPAERGQPLPSPKRPAPSPQGSDGS